MGLEYRARFIGEAQDGGSLPAEGPRPPGVMAIDE